MTFFPVANAGLFDLNFTDGTAVSIYGADVGSSLTLMPGTYPATSGINDVLPGTGSGTVTLTAVPELPTWAMMTLGFAGLGLAGFRARRSAVAALEQPMNSLLEAVRPRTASFRKSARGTSPRGDEIHAVRVPTKPARINLETDISLAQ